MVGVLSLAEEIRAMLPSTVAASIGAREAAVQTVTAATAQLAARVAELDARLGQNSSNSSRPPSSDPPGAAPSSKPTRGARRPGGQPGHRGVVRALAPPARVTHTQRQLPPACAHRGTTRAAAAAVDDPPDQRHQVVDVRPSTVEVTAYQVAARTCGAGGALTRAPWPVGAPQGVVGPRRAMTRAVLTGRYRLSKREAAACLADLFGIELAIGTVSAITHQVRTALAPIVAEARAAVQGAPVVNLDETGWRQGRQRAWPWTAVTALVTVFHSDPSRSSQVVRTLVGADWDGIVGSDRFSAYRWVGVAWRQGCWAHLRRDFQKLVEWGPGPRPMGNRLVACHDQVFEPWHRHRAGERDRADLAVAISRVAAERRAVRETGAASGHAAAHPLCRALLALWPALWPFVVVEGVEPTTNRAEQALRPAVLWRKGSVGAHRAAGSRFVERMLTVTATCRQHDRRVADFLITALRAAQAGQTLPSLLPATT